MTVDTRPLAALLTAGRYTSADAKSAHGLVRGPSRFRIVGLVDGPASAGRDAGELLDGSARQLPIYASLDELLAHSPQLPTWAIVGVATSGGVLTSELRAQIASALARGLSVVNGLHDLVGDDPALTALAAAAGATVVDLRRPKPFGELAFWSGAIRAVRAPRVAVLGTDCALGKRTSCHLVAEACRRAGIRTEIVTTGQTGWLQGSRWGFILDATPNDFVCGELERAVVACAREAAPDLILLEGQSALRNPSGPCGAELLLGAEARAVILQHAPARRFFEDQEALGNEIPPLFDEIELIGKYGARVLGLTLNHERLAPGEREPLRQRLARELALPVVYPLAGGVDELVPALRRYLEGASR